MENVPELVEHFPQNLLKKYTECCKLNEDLNEIKYFSQDDEFAESDSFNQDDTNAESNSFSSDTTDTESNSFSQDTSNAESEGNNSRELNPTLTWEVLAKKIAKTQYCW